MVILGPYHQQELQTYVPKETVFFYDIDKRWKDKTVAAFAGLRATFGETNRYIS